jgi:GTP-binding protein EngB required for normal cell division
VGESYPVLKDQLTRSLDRLVGVAASRDDRLIATAAETLRTKLDDDRFTVVVAGAFKRGKSTFVNALLGANLLPTAVAPLTSTVTALTWGPQPRAEITFADGREETAEVDELSAYVTERENPGNARGVHRVVVRYPAQWLAGGMYLVDTPGVGSVHGHNTDAAHAFIPEADAAIFLTSADPPISADERSFLEEVSEEASRMFFVLNKIDYLSGPDLEESLAFTQRVLEESIGRAVTVYALSARGALEAKQRGDAHAADASGLPRFEDDFGRFLLRERGAALLESVARGVRKLLADEMNSIAVQSRAATLTVREVEDVIARMEAVFAEAEARRHDTSLLLRVAINEIISVVEADVAELRRAETARLIAEAERFLGDSLDLRAATKALDEHLEHQLRRAFDRWRASEDRKVAELYRSATRRFIDEADGVVRRTVDACGEALGTSLQGPVSAGELRADGDFSYRFFQAPTIAESILPDMGGVLPRRYNRSRALKRVRDKTPLMVDKQCGRLLWDFAKRLDRSMLSLKQQLNERLAATVQSLRAGLERAVDERAEQEGAAAAAAGRDMDARQALAAIDAELGRFLAIVGESAETETQVADRA